MIDVIFMCTYNTNTMTSLSQNVLGLRISNNIHSLKSTNYAKLNSLTWYCLRTSLTGAIDNELLNYDAIRDTAAIPYNGVVLSSSRLFKTRFHCCSTQEGSIERFKYSDVSYSIQYTLVPVNRQSSIQYTVHSCTSERTNWCNVKQCCNTRQLRVEASSLFLFFIYTNNCFRNVTFAVIS